jgi:hypothetical protein
MRPALEDRATPIVRANLPEFEDRYQIVAEAYGEDLTPQVVLNELAEYAAELVRTDEPGDALARCLRAVELVATAPDADGTELVAFCFLDQLPGFARAQIAPYLEPSSARILEALQADLLYGADDEIPLFGSDLTATQPDDPSAAP